MAAPLAGKFALVTGASRGVGRGIALQLGQAGATVLITGRAPAQSFSATHTDFVHLPSLEQTKRDIESRGGKAVAIYCDHSEPAEVEKLFEKVGTITGDRLDILVNNAFSAVSELNSSSGRPFYELEPSMWDAFNNVGLRNHYYCAVYACRIMAKRKSGLVVNISSLAGLAYAFNVAYGCESVAIDRMAADMAVELKGTGVSIVSLWLGGVKTETAQVFLSSEHATDSVLSTDVANATLIDGESTEFAGKCIAALAADAKVHNKSGKVLFSSDLAREYGFRDIDGKMPLHARSLQLALKLTGSSRAATWTPACIRIPKSFLHFASYKFD